MSAADRLERLPLKFPMAVRAALTTTISVIVL
jgi:hypothetical protein